MLGRARRYPGGPSSFWPAGGPTAALRARARSARITWLGWSCFVACLFFGGPAFGAPVDFAPWQSEAGFRWRPLPAPQARTGFVRLDAETSGLRFTNSLDEWSGAANRVLYNGAGVAAGDFDGDGLPDLFFCHLGGANALFRNLGNARFENVTAAPGLGEPLPQSRGATFADLNGDRDLDLLVSVNGRGVLCFLNDGRGHFREATATAGTGGRSGSTTLDLADVDGNGTLDLYVTHYRNEDIRDRGRVNLT